MKLNDEFQKIRFEKQDREVSSSPQNSRSEPKENPAKIIRRLEKKAESRKIVAKQVFQKLTEKIAENDNLKSNMKSCHFKLERKFFEQVTFFDKFFNLKFERYKERFLKLQAKLNMIQEACLRNHPQYDTSMPNSTSLTDNLACNGNDKTKELLLESLNEKNLQKDEIIAQLESKLNEMQIYQQKFLNSDQMNKQLSDQIVKLKQQLVEATSRCLKGDLNLKAKADDKISNSEAVSNLKNQLDQFKEEQSRLLEIIKNLTSERNSGKENFSSSVHLKKLASKMSGIQENFNLQEQFQVTNKIHYNFEKSENESDLFKSQDEEKGRNSEVIFTNNLNLFENQGSIENDDFFTERNNNNLDLNEFQRKTITFANASEKQSIQSNLDNGSYFINENILVASPNKLIKSKSLKPIIKNEGSSCEKNINFQGYSINNEFYNSQGQKKNSEPHIYLNSIFASKAIRESKSIDYQNAYMISDANYELQSDKILNSNNSLQKTQLSNKKTYNMGTEFKNSEFDSIVHDEFLMDEKLSEEVKSSKNLYPTKNKLLEQQAQIFKCELEKTESLIHQEFKNLSKVSSYFANDNLENIKTDSLYSLENIKIEFEEFKRISEENEEVFRAQIQALIDNQNDMVYELEQVQSENSKLNNHVLELNSKIESLTKELDFEKIALKNFKEIDTKKELEREAAINLIEEKNQNLSVNLLEKEYEISKLTNQLIENQEELKMLKKQTLNNKRSFKIDEEDNNISEKNNQSLDAQDQNNYWMENFENLKLEFLSQEEKLANIIEENDILRNELSNKEEYIVELINEKEQLAKDISELYHDQERMQKLECQVNEVDVFLREQTTENYELTAKLILCEKTLKHAENDNKALEDKVEFYMELLKSEKRGYDSSLDLLYRENENLKSKIENYKNLKATLKEEILDYENQKLAMSSRLEEVEFNNNELNKKIRNFIGKFQKINKIVSTRFSIEESRCSELAGKISNAFQLFNDRKEFCEEQFEQEFQLEMENHKSQIEELKTTLEGEKDALALEYQAQMQPLYDRIADLENALNIQQNDINKSEKDIKDDVVDQTDKIEELKNQIEFEKHDFESFRVEKITQINELKDELENKINLVAHLETINKQLSKMLQARKTEEEALESQNSIIKQNCCNEKDEMIKNLTHKLDDQEIETKKLKIQHDKINNAFLRANEEINFLEDKNTKMEEEIENIKIAFKDKLSHFKSIENEKNEAISDLKKILNQTIIELEQANSNSDKFLSQIQKDNDDLLKSTTTELMLKEEIDMLKNLVKDENDNYATVINSKANEIAELNNVLNDKSISISQLEGKIKLLTQDCEKLNSIINELTVANGKINSMLAQKEKLSNDLQNLSESQKETISKYEMQIFENAESTKKEITKLKKELSEVVENSANQIEALNRAKNNIEMKLKKLEEELHETKEELNLKIEKETSLKKDNSAKSEQISELENQVIGLKKIEAEFSLFKNRQSEINNDSIVLKTNQDCQTCSDFKAKLTNKDEEIEKIKLELTDLKKKCSNLIQSYKLKLKQTISKISKCYNESIFHFQSAHDKTVETTKKRIFNTLLKFEHLKIKTKQTVQNNNILLEKIKNYEEQFNKDKNDSKYNENSLKQSELLFETKSTVLKLENVVSDREQLVAKLKNDNNMCQKDNQNKINLLNNKIKELSESNLKLEKDVEILTSKKGKSQVKNELRLLTHENDELKESCLSLREQLSSLNMDKEAIEMNFKTYKTQTAGLLSKKEIVPSSDDFKKKEISYTSEITKLEEVSAKLLELSTFVEKIVQMEMKPSNIKLIEAKLQKYANSDTMLLELEKFIGKELKIYLDRDTMIRKIKEIVRNWIAQREVNALDDSQNLKSRDLSNKVDLTIDNEELALTLKKLEHQVKDFEDEIEAHKATIEQLNFEKKELQNRMFKSTTSLLDETKDQKPVYIPSVNGQKPFSFVFDNEISMKENLKKLIISFFANLLKKTKNMEVINNITSLLEFSPDEKTEFHRMLDTSYINEKIKKSIAS